MRIAARPIGELEPCRDLGVLAAELLPHPMEMSELLQVIA